MIISKLDKIILLTRILPYIDDDDINKLSSVCKVMRKLILSPMGMKIIVYNKTKRMAEYFRDNVMSKASFQHINAHVEHISDNQRNIDSLKEDQSEEINTLRNVKKFLTQKLQQNQLTLDSMQKELVFANELLQQEKRENKTIKDRLMGLEEIRESNKEIVKEMNLKYANIVHIHL